MPLYTIHKVTANPTVDFAAEELKKYLRMMMPECGEICIDGNAAAKDGFRLGVMADFGLDAPEAGDLALDDVLCIDTDEKGGVIAGSNQRSVLLAVYRYLRENGCRWLFAGPEGEDIPVRDVAPVKYRKMAASRVRGWCNEGAEFQQCMLSAIDIAPKLGMNTFMTEFVNPKAYYNNYFDHLHNEANREPEPVDPETTLQWKRACEAEIAKRGLLFHDVGHGWTVNPFGIDSSEGWSPRDESIIPEGSRQYLAEIGGRRGFFKGSPLVTQFCMSSAKARRIVAEAVADYAAGHQNVDYLHVWLADFIDNHCECENCRRKQPADWYITLMNDIDAVLTERGMDTKIVFICYTETIFPAKTVTLAHPERFSMLFAPISRQYYEAVPVHPKKCTPVAYELNHLHMPDNSDEYLMYGNACKALYRAPSFLYEYHFTFKQYYNPGNMDYARLIYDDVRAYRAHGYCGMIQDGTQRNFWPNGLLLTVYAETLFDGEADFDALVADYYAHAYGEIAPRVTDFMKKIGGFVSMKYLTGKDRVDKEISRLYNPAYTEKLRELRAACEEFLPFLREHRIGRKRVQTLAVKLLCHYLNFWIGLTRPLAMMSTGTQCREAAVAFHDFFDEFGRSEAEYEDYCDFLNIACAFADRYFYGFRRDIPDNPKNAPAPDMVGGIPETN